MKIRDTVITALFAAVLCVAAPFSIQIGPIPLSLATFVIYIAAAALDYKYASLAVVLYVLLGAAGVPVFSGFSGGFQKIAGPTGGYIIGYLPCALAAGLIITAGKRKLIFSILGMVIGTVLLYTLGTAWYMLQMEYTLIQALALCVFPFLIGDAVKIAAAVYIAPRLRQALRPSTN